MMNTYIRGLVAVVFYCLPVSFSWSVPLNELTRLPSGDFWLGPEGTYPLHPENEEQRIITRADANASVKGFSVALNSESAPLHMQFYDNVDTSELVIDLSDMAGLTPLMLQKTEFNDPRNNASSEQIKISTQFEGLTHEFVILGESGALPDLKLTRHLSTSQLKTDIVIPVREWLAPHPLQKRASARDSADRFVRAGRNETDGSNQVEHLDIALSLTGFFVLGVVVGECSWVVSYIRFYNHIPYIVIITAMMLRISSYIFGFGIPLVQEIIIRAVYFKVKHKSLGMFFIPGCCEN